LGQTVNSYKHVADGVTTDMAALLEQLHDVDGVDRIKFVTNYPKDMTERLLTTIRDLPKVAPYLHVPAQSGSDVVLKRMKRGYTIADYMEMFERIETILPHATVSSDFIVGFCGETEEDFRKSIELVERCRFKNSFIFQYSERPGTKASERLPDDIPRDVKARRNNELLAVQDAIAQEDNDKLIGEVVEVLVEGPSKKGQKESDDQAVVQMTGRTHRDRIVVFDGNRRQAGQFLNIHIDDASCHTLVGRVQTVDVVSIGMS
ncbi:MAG: radical SAM protein, partial [Pirellulaceae bacterium]|nr:radical SAM protein [Pirellulaceae bacterium]